MIAHFLLRACLCGIRAEPYRYPSSKPTTIEPSEIPSIKPSQNPTVSPSIRPSKFPKLNPTQSPASIPSYQPTNRPSSSQSPSPVPSSRPSRAPSSQPSRQPSRQPTSQPSRQPSSQPTTNPTNPTSRPTSSPSKSRRPTTQQPTFRPSYSLSPSIKPTITPTAKPTTIKPSMVPSVIPSIAPSMPTLLPSYTTTAGPTLKPSAKPTLAPSMRPSIPTSQPSSTPSQRPSSQPSCRPTKQPFGSPSSLPSSHPTTEPTYTHMPSRQPTSQPSREPTSWPTFRPTGSPTNTHKPTQLPSGQPTRIPSSFPTRQPTGQPSFQPTSQPSNPTGQPTSQPSMQPTSQPSRQPSRQPTSQPTRQPSMQPTSKPTSPTGQPTNVPTRNPSSQPTCKPSHTPKPSVSPAPTSQPSSQPSGVPSVQPTGVPSMNPTATYAPTSRPTKKPRPAPTSMPTWSIGDFTDSPTATFQNMGVSGYVKVDPDNAHTCTPLEVQITLQFNKNLSAGSVFYITTPGLTSGPCYSAEDGENINSLSIPNTDMFDASFTEGTYINNYADSKLKFEVLNDIDSINPMYIVLDRSNELRHTCSTNVSWIVSVTPLSKNGGESGFIDYSSSHHRKCNIFYSKLNFTNPMPQFPTAINITMHFGYTLLDDTIVTIKLPGFTNVRGGYTLNYQKTNATDVVGNGVSRQLYNITASTNFSWVGHWYEGTHETNYEGAYLTLTSLGGQLYHTPFWVMIGKENHLIPTRGSAINDTKYHISSNDSTLNYYYTPDQAVIESNAVGQGCTLLDDCNNHGRCNYNTSLCECDDGYGSKLDRSRSMSQDFNLDCSSKACPIGPAVGTVFQYNNVTNTTKDAHRMMECSNNGICLRASGTCQCNAGYGGTACQKMICPDQCNNRGVCQSMRRLAFNTEAIPLSKVGKPYQEGSNATKNVAWDSDFGHMCVCDSSWPVGLGAGERQQAEFFGPSCEYRRCPTGDDPDTIHVDETNCTGKALLNKHTNKYTLGDPGNLCHVDCSNRGSCDYKTGLCKCFDGYGGENCGYRLSQLYTMKNVTNTWRPGIVNSKHSEL